MRIVKNTLIVFLLLLINSNAQFYEGLKGNGEGKPGFEYSVTRQFNVELKGVELTLFVNIINDNLTFLKSDTSGFDAEVEWLMAVYQDEKLAFSRTITKVINVENYETTNSKIESTLLSSKVLVAPGEYQVLMRTIDLNTNKMAQTRVDVIAPSFYENPAAVSDILLFKSYELDSMGAVKHYDPILEDNFSVKSGIFYIYFNLYTKELDSEVTINYKFTGPTKSIDFDTTYVQKTSQHFNPHILKINKRIFKENSYNINVSANVNGEIFSSDKNITFYWSSVPGSVTDIETALNQMSYLISSDSLDYYINQDLDEQQLFFKRFWQQRDPNPKTPENELMDEYYTRINYADKNFSSFSLSGWRTDRGRIFIKFGDPDEVDRHPFEIDSNPYVVWRYYRLRKVFVFWDYTGFGDFRLHPDYIHVEYE